MMNRIDEIQRQYMYTVQPVQLFETNKSNNTPKSTFDFINQMYSNSSGYNPFHPNVQNETTAKRLDILS